LQAEDNLAQAFCLVGELQLSVDHCKASIQVILFLTSLLVWLVSATLQKQKEKKEWGSRSLVIGIFLATSISFLIART